MGLSRRIHAAAFNFMAGVTPPMPMLGVARCCKMGWLPPSPDGIAMCQKVVVKEPRSGEDGQMKDIMIGVDLAKSVFQVRGASMTGQLKYSKKLTRTQFQKFMADRSPAVVAMEACGSAHYWTLEMIKLGDDVKLIAPQYVRPFVKRQKNDIADADADAEAIVIAAQRPEMRFVAPKGFDDVTN